MNFFLTVFLLFFIQISKSWALINNVKIPKTQLPAILKADIILGDKINQEIQAFGSVEISKESSIIFADRIVYNKNTKVISGDGNVIAKNLEIGNLLAPNFDIKDDFSSGNFYNARIFFSDGSYLFSKKILRLSPQKTNLDRPIFSICPNEEIAKNNSRAGNIFDFITIKSSSTTIDKDSNNFISKNSVIKFYKVPVFYIPYLRFALPSKGRQSGFLQPSYAKTSNFGLGIKTPYFIDINKSTDLTISPIYYLSSKQLIVNNEWRQFAKYGKYNLNLELANNKVRNNNIDKTIIKRSNKNLRWLASGEGKFNFDNNFGLDYELKTLSDRTYLRDYSFDYLAYSVSKVNFDYIYKRNYVGIKSIRFQELENEALENNSPLILPTFNTYHETEPLFFKEKLILKTNFTSIHRKEGLQYNRGSLIPQFKIPFNIKGNLFELSSKLQADLYALNDKDIRAQDNIRIYKSSQSDLKSEIAFNWRLPIRNKSSLKTITIEPMANFVMSQYKSRNSIIPLEDSTNSELTFSNLFANDRISGFDRNEAGKRVSYGLKTSLFNDLGEFNITAGQAIILKKDEQDVKIRGFANNNRSNIVGIASFKGKKYFSISYSFQLDQSNFRNDVNQVYSTINYKKFELGVDYLLIRRNIFNDTKREQATFKSSFSLPNKWNFKVFVTRDFVRSRFIQRGVELIRNGCCSDFGFSVIEQNPSNLTKPQKTFNLNFTIKNL